MRGAILIVSLPVLLALATTIEFTWSNRNNGSIVTSGEKREYLLHVPRTLDKNRPVPLVVTLHGAGMWPVLQRDYSGWSELADREGFIVVYPEGRAGGMRIWRMTGQRDQQFIADLIDKLQREYPIDGRRIYVNGLSNGGGMSWALTCSMPDRFAAAGLVGAALLLPPSWCKSNEPVPMIGIHGLDDAWAPYDGGQSWIAPQPFAPFLPFGAAWARRNRCDPEPRDAAVRDGIARREYSGCAHDASVVLYTLRDGGHTWPGGRDLPEWFAGKTIRDFSATEEMWRFFEAHSKPVHTVSLEAAD